jgi:hypothetical protein
MAKFESVEIPQDIIDNIIAEVGADKDVLKQMHPSFLFPSP